MASSIDIKLTFLHEAALHLKKDDPTIAEHVQPVLVEVNNNIQVRDAPSSDHFSRPADAHNENGGLCCAQAAEADYSAEQQRTSRIVRMMLQGL